MSDPITLTINGVPAVETAVAYSGDTIGLVISDVGERGLTGATGPAGPPNSLSIGTVSQGTAAASLTGTSPNQVLNLTLPKGDTGAAATNIELQSSGSYLQWRYVGGSSWTNLVALSAITGPTGPSNSLTVGTVSQGAAAATITGTAPNQVLNLTLPQGDPGTPATNIELQSNGTYLQWRYVGGSSWTNLVALSAITGPVGPANSLSIGTVYSGSTPSATITGTAPNQILNLVLAKGDAGQAGAAGAAGPGNTLSIGTVSSGSSAGASITGTSPSQTLNLQIPVNTLTIGTVAGGDTAAATITGTAPNQSLNLTLPKGDAGATGPRGAAGEGGFSQVSSYSALPASGSATTLYAATDTGFLWRWNSATSAYVQCGGSGSGSGEDTLLRSLLKPPAPTGVTATAGNSQVALAWTAPTVLSVLPITDYVIQSSTNSGSTWATVSDGTSTSTSATVTSLVNGDSYAFRVAGVNAVGTGPFSAATASVTPAAQSVTLTSGGGYNSWRWQSNGYFDATPFSGGQYIVGKYEGVQGNGGWRTTWAVPTKPASVLSAVLTIPTELRNGTPFAVLIKGANLDNAGGGLTGSSTTTASANSTSTGDLVADVTGIVNEIISRSGWVSGNSLVFYLLGDNALSNGSDNSWRQTSDTVGSLTINW